MFDKISTESLIRLLDYLRRAEYVDDLLPVLTQREAELVEDLISDTGCGAEKRIEELRYLVTLPNLVREELAMRGSGE